MKKLLLLLLVTSLHANGHILYLMKKGQVERAVEAYQTQVADVSGHDFELLRKMAFSLLESATTVQEGEEQMLALFGAGVAQDPNLLPVFRSGLNSRHPEVQAAAINLISNLDHDALSGLLKQNLSSPFLLIRLEALFQLAQRRDPDAAAQLESLMVKLPSEIHPLFPQLFGMIGSTDADRVLRRFLADRNPDVKRATILTLAQHGRDDYLADIRILSKQHDPKQQEACAVALGILQDTSSIERLDKLSYSPEANVRVAALKSLYHLGRKGARFHLEAMARRGDPFAITALADMEGSQQTLSELTHSRNLVTRINAAAALNDPDGLAEILVEDSRDLGYIIQFSPGGALPAIRPISGMHQYLKENPSLVEVSRSLREQLLVKAMDLPEEDFLRLANHIFEAQQTDLVPLLVTLLESIGTENAYLLLEKQTKRVGSPLIRNYCNLALFRSEREGPFEENLHAWIQQERGKELFQLRPLLSWDQRQDNFVLTPEETSRLLIDSFEALAHRQDTIAVEALLEALKEGNPRNRYPLAGLLFRITE